MPAYDIVIRNGRVADGTGKKLFAADVAVKGDRIAVVDSPGSLKGAQLGGADLTGVTLIDTDFDGADLASAKLIAPIGLDRAKNFDMAKNRDRLIKQ